VSGQVASNVRLRIHLAEGRDAYFVWNEAHGLPVQATTTADDFNRRNLVFKYTHAVRW
jgi:hypothetical protein